MMCPSALWWSSGSRLLPHVCEVLGYDLMSRNLPQSYLEIMQGHLLLNVPWPHEAKAWFIKEKFLWKFEFEDWVNWEILLAKPSVLLSVQYRSFKSGLMGHWKFLERAHQAGLASLVRDYEKRNSSAHQLKPRGRLTKQITLKLAISDHLEPQKCRRDRLV